MKKKKLHIKKFNDGGGKQGPGSDGGDDCDGGGSGGGGVRDGRGRSAKKKSRSQ